MANELALTIAVSATAGGGMAVFGSLKEVMQRVAGVTRRLTQDNRVLSAAIKKTSADNQPEIDRLTAQYNKQREAVDKLWTATRRLSDIQKHISDNAANRAQMRGEIMETIGVSYALAAPIRVAIDAEEAFADVKKVVDERVPELEAYLIEASKRIPQSFAELSQIASGGAQGGIVRDELEKYVDLVAKMSVAGDLTSEYAGESIAKIKNIFTANIDRIGELGDVINYLSNRESAKYGQIIDVLKRASSTAQMFGFNERQTAGLSTAFLALGKTEETAGTAINAMLLKLASADVQAPKFQDALEEMGLSAKALKKAISQDAEGALTMFLEKVRQLPKEKQLGVMNRMFGQQYADDVALLAQNIDVYKRVMQEAGDATRYAGSMGKEFAARSATTKNAFRLLDNAFTAMSITLGHDLLPTIKSLIDGHIIPAVEWTSKWIKRHQAFVSVAIRVAAALLSMRMGFLVVRYAAAMAMLPFLQLKKMGEIVHATWAMKTAAGWKVAIPILSTASRQLDVVRGGIIKLFTASAAAGGPLKLLTGKLVAVVGAARALIFTPIGIALTALAIAGYLIYKNWAGASVFFSGLWDGIVAVVGPALTEIGKGFSALGGIFAPLIDIFSLFAGWIGAWSSSLIPAGEGTREFGEVVGHVLGTIVRGLLLPLEMISYLIQSVSMLVTSFYDIGKGIVTGMTQGFTDSIGEWYNATREWMNDTIENVRMKLGINSPSRVFAEIGGFMAAGLNEGLTEKMGVPMETVKRLAAQLAAAGAIALTPALSQAVPPPAMDALTPLARNPAGQGMAGAAGGFGAGSVSNVTINVNPAPGMDERALAELVVRKIHEAERAAQVRARSRLSDAD